MSDTQQIKNGQKKEIKFTTGLMIFIVLQTLSAVWWASSINSEQAYIAKQVSASVTNAQAQNLQIQIDGNKGDVTEIKALLIRIEDKIDRL